MTTLRIAKTHFSSSSIPQSSRESAYREQVDRALDTQFLDPSDTVFTFNWCHVGSMRVFEAEASARRTIRTAAQIAHDRYDGISVQLAVSGSADGTTAARTITSEPGTIMLLDFAQPFDITDAESRAVINLALPRALLTSHIVDLTAIHGMVLGGDQAALLRAFILDFVPRIETLPVRSGEAIVRVVVELLLLALAIDPLAVDGTAGDGHAVLRDRARALIDGRIGSADVTPQWLCTRLNVSRSELYRAFEGGGGVSRFIWQRRSEAARKALTDPGDRRRIGEIAFQLGFSSEAHFSRLFRQAFGITPSEARRRSRAPEQTKPT